MLYLGLLNLGSGSCDWPSTLARPCYRPVYAQAKHSRGAYDETHKKRVWLDGPADTTNIVNMIKDAMAD